MLTCSSHLLRIDQHKSEQCGAAETAQVEYGHCGKGRGELGTADGAGGRYSRALASPAAMQIGQLEACVLFLPSLTPICC
jgi:hypothetical protein